MQMDTPNLFVEINNTNYIFIVGKYNENQKLEIKPSMIQLTKEIKSLGDFKVKIDLHPQIQAVIDIEVVTEETVQ